MKKILWIVLTSLVLMPASAQATGEKDKKAEKLVLQENIKKAVEEQNYNVEVDRAMPLRGKMVNLSPPYSVKVQNDSAFFNLPYFGVSHNVGYGDDGGIKFEELMKDYTVKFNEKKNYYTVSFDIRSRKDSYGIIMDIYLDGRVSIRISPTQSDFISYSGDVVIEGDE